MELPIYNYPSFGLSCHWHAICQQLAGSVGIMDALVNNKGIARQNAIKELERLEKDLENAGTKHQRRVIETDIAHINNLDEAIDFLLMTLKAVHSEEGYMTYVSKQRNIMRTLIKRYYDIDICKSDYINMFFNCFMR